ncbi:hypothetical protein EGJ03_09570 [Stenotrophomonas maltophilia]|nr:hypothetical protein EGJ06_03665 [Stenotrophomonas maltophilia]RRU13679.1 hypothetical protein EGJ77_03270 [Stenotrophomonas maltophilia]RRU32127.1 hypothetical protein EGJ03_09570 [Stenotrophomonas maltophilia]RRU99569.1 hypothetical protein EGI91_04520 [Stenotrophomonas maltophilia]
MSILNVLLRPDQLLVAVDTLAEDAFTGVPSAGAKLLLIPQHNLVLATRGSTQFFLRIYELALQASFRADFTMEQLMAELGLVIDKLWPAYEKAADEAGLPRTSLGTELVLGGWSPKNGRMVATAYAKHDSTTSAIVQPLDGGLASPGEPLEGRPDSFELADVLHAGRLQVAWLNRAVGRQVAGGRLLVATLSESRAVVEDLGAL